MTVLEKIKANWAKYPEVNLNILKIQDRQQIPRWEDCKKNELWIGIKQNRKGNKIYVVRHRMETVFDLACPFEQLTDSELTFIGVYPQKNHYCRVCGEFSTRINKDGRCCDCCESKDQN